MLIELETKIQMKKINPDNIHAIILLVENSKFQGLDKPYYEKICGRPMHSYLENVCFGFKKTLVVLNENENIATAVKGHLNECGITIILFSDTPLVSRQTIEDYINKFIYSNSSFVAMPRGFVFETNYLKACDNIEQIFQNNFEQSEFQIVNNLQDFEKITRIMQNKILNFHMNCGVKILDKQTVKIDADVNIEKTAEIGPFSQILGRSSIGEKTKINSSIIRDCKIENNCMIENCNLEKCKVFENVNVKPFTFEKGKEIRGE